MDNNKIGNQQERFLEWFGGIVDGEGCLTFKSRWQRHRYIQITPVLIINNTSKTLIDECIKGLGELKIPFWVNTKYPKKYKTIYTIEVSGLKRFARLLPYLRVRAKKDQVDILRRFTESRLQLKGKEKTPYTKKELLIVAELAKIHTRKNPQRLYARLLQHQGE
jgi:hypothetical protein